MPTGFSEIRSLVFIPKERREERVLVSLLALPEDL